MTLKGVTLHLFCIDSWCFLYIANFALETFVNRHTITSSNINLADRSEDPKNNTIFADFEYCGCTKFIAAYGAQKCTSAIIHLLTKQIFGRVVVLLIGY